MSHDRDLSEENADLRRENTRLRDRLHKIAALQSSSDLGCPLEPEERDFLTRAVELVRLGRKGKYPTNRHLAGSLSEEVGEVHRAYIKGEGDSRVRAEALDVAAVALRLYVEGDSSYGAPLIDWRNK